MTDPEVPTIAQAVAGLPGSTRIALAEHYAATLARTDDPGLRRFWAAVAAAVLIEDRRFNAEWREVLTELGPD